MPPADFPPADAAPADPPPADPLPADPPPAEPSPVQPSRADAAPAEPPPADPPGGQDPAGRAHGQGGMRAVLAALGANLGIAATKFVAFVITGSASMLAESVQSVADSGNQVLLLVGRKRARREETEQHQFGFGAERYVYAFIVAVVLFVVGAIFSVYERVSLIAHPEE